MVLLQANHIVKRYSHHTALDDVSISVPAQSIFGLLGPNGAGKTSLIRIINQITGPDIGEIFFENEKLNPSHTARIGYLPEERGLYKKMEVGEQALYLAQLKGMKKSEAKIKLKEWFVRFEMESWWNKKVEELSKGMQQKVQFVVTVLHQPKLIILDEPFSGFDPINANVIKREIFKLKEQGATVIFSTHNMGSVEELCDNIALINKSKKILDGTVKEIRKAHKSNTFEITYTGSAMAFANALWNGAKILEQSKEEDVNKVTLRLQAGHKINDVLQSLLPVVEINGIIEIIPGMNEIFISKVKEQQPEMKIVHTLTE